MQNVVVSLALNVFGYVCIMHVDDSQGCLWTTVAAHRLTNTDFNGSHVYQCQALCWQRVLKAMPEVNMSDSHFTSKNSMFVSMSWKFLTTTCAATSATGALV